MLNILNFEIGELKPSSLSVTVEHLITVLMGTRHSYAVHNKPKGVQLFLRLITLGSVHQFIHFGYEFVVCVLGIQNLNF